MQAQFQPFLISFLIGLLIGIDRERSLPRGLKGMGVRSFTLIAILGTLVAVVNNIALTLTLSVFVCGAILLNYYYAANMKGNHKAIGLTTGLAGATVYILGYLSPSEPALASVIGVTILLILLGRERLHAFAKEKLQPKEISAATIMVVIFISVLVFLPNQPIDPWQLFNPRRFGMLIAIIASMQFIGYVAIRVFGEHLGMVFVGFFGGLVSSTAVFATLPNYVKHNPTHIRTASAAALLATVATLLEFALIVSIAAPNLLIAIVRPVATMTLTGTIIAFVLYRQDRLAASFNIPKNPLDVKSVLGLSLVIAFMLITVALARVYFGPKAVQAVSFLGGLFELQSVSLATATLYQSKALILTEAKNALFLAVLASFLTKFLLLISFARNQFGLLTASLLAVMLSTGILSYLFG